MIEQITVTVDRMLIPVAERCAKECGMKLDDWINLALWDATGEDRPGFGTRWLGVANPDGKHFTEEDIDRMRLEAIEKKHLQ